MQEKTIEYVLRIGPPDRYRHLHVQQGGKIVFFRVQYETKIRDLWYPVVRYNTAYGFAHKDLLNIHGDIKKTPLFNQDYNDTDTLAESDLKTNWILYKRAFTKGLIDKRGTEFFEKNIELSAEFSRYLFDHPELSSQIPSDSELVLVPEFDEKLKEFNLSLGRKIEGEGGRVICVVIKHINPKSYSRLTSVELKRAASW